MNSRFLHRFKLTADRVAVSAAGMISFFLYRRRGRGDVAKNTGHVRLLSIEIGGLGDLTRITSFRELLRAAHPENRLTVVTHRRNSDFFQWAPAPDSLIYFDPSHRSFWGKILFFLRLQCSAPFDVVADFTGSYFSAWITALSGAGLSAGSPREGFSLFYTNPVQRYRDRPLAEHYADLLRSLDVPGIPVFPGTAPRSSPGTPFISGDHLPKVVIHPGSGWPGRRWPKGRWIELVHELSEKNGVEIVVTGGPKERELAEQVAAAGKDVKNLSGRLSFIELAHLLEVADLFISANVGPMHLARAVGCPTVTLFGPYSHIETGYPDDKTHTAVLRHLPCSPCGTYTEMPVCSHFSCLNGITVKEVLTAALAALRKQGGSRMVAKR